MTKAMRKAKSSQGEDRKKRGKYQGRGSTPETVYYWSFKPPRLKRDMVSAEEFVAENIPQVEIPSVQHA
eukprot:g20013.t1